RRPRQHAHGIAQVLQEGTHRKLTPLYSSYGGGARAAPEATGGRARVAPQAGARSQEGARRGGWLGRREGANRSVARCLCAARVRIRARPRTTPAAPYRPAPL